jgi:hypothetical protein
MKFENDGEIVVLEFTKESQEKEIEKILIFLENLLMLSNQFRNANWGCKREGPRKKQHKKKVQQNAGRKKLSTTNKIRDTYKLLAYPETDPSELNTLIRFIRGGMVEIIKTNLRGRNLELSSCTNFIICFKSFKPDGIYRLYDTFTHNVIAMKK